MGHFVYLFVDKITGEKLYIGKNDTDLVSRVYAHGHSGDNVDPSGWDELNKADVYYIQTINRNMSDVIESEMCIRYHPKYNTEKMSLWDSALEFNPQWKPLPRDTKEQNPQNVGCNYLYAPYTNSKKYQIKQKFITCYEEVVNMGSLLSFLRKNINNLPDAGEIRLWNFRTNKSMCLGFTDSNNNHRFIINVSCWGWDVEPISHKNMWFADVTFCNNWKNNLNGSENELHQEIEFLQSLYLLLQQHYPNALEKPKRKKISKFYSIIEQYILGNTFDEFYEIYL